MRTMDSHTYTLEYVKNISRYVENGEAKDVSLMHDDFLNHWRITFELEPTRYWFLSVFLRDSGTIEKYSLDYEAASDSHYEFKDEYSVRELLYADCDEKQYLHELFINYIKEHGGFDLLNLIRPFITMECHYD